MKEVELYTERLKLRLLQESDIEEVHKLLSIPEVDQYNTLGIPKNIEATRKIEQALFDNHKKEEIDYYTFAVLLKDSNEFIGKAAFIVAPKKYQSGEVWYKYNPKYWGKGYATEVANCLLDFGFNTLNLHRIEAGCAVDNIGSIKVLEKIGMTREGRKRQLLPLKTGWSDNYEYAILDTDPRK